MADTLLAERPLLGYPGASVQLHVLQDGYKVVVGEHEWKTTSRLVAKEWFFHPFVHGYEYTPVSEVEA